MIVFLFVFNILFNTVYGTNHVKETRFVGYFRRCYAHVPMTPHKQKFTRQGYFRKHFGGSMTSAETIFNFQDNSIAD